MAKTTRKKASQSATEGGETKINKSAAIRDYLAGHKDAKPKEVVAVLKEQGIEVSPNVVSIVKAKLKVKAARRRSRQWAAIPQSIAVANGNGGDGLEAAITLYKAARGQEVPSPKVRNAFLALVELLG